MNENSFDISESIRNNLQNFEDSDVEYYEYLATLDCKTCPICGELDKKQFKVSDALQGTNCPPMHDGCRCSITAVIETDGLQHMDMRRMREPKTGKSVVVPNMSYVEWKKEYLDK